jgi:hypothetical protein
MRSGSGMIKRLAGLRAYPFLMASYPALAMMAANVEQVRMETVVRPLLSSLLLCGVLYGVLALILRRPEPPAILTTWWLLLFFAYGHVYSALQDVHLLGESLGRHRYLGVLWLVLALAGAWWTLRRMEWGSTARVLTVVSVVAVAMPVVQLAAYLVESSVIAADQAASGSMSSSTGHLPEGQVLTAPADQRLPDIYYIILDGYGRSDTLEQVYGFDNTEFLDALQSMGFIVAECSQANYAQTELSVASSTNLRYLDALGTSFRPGTDNRRPLQPLIRSSAVRRALESLGYRTIAFDTGYPFINLEDADRYFSPRLGNGLSGFELMFLRSTAGLLALDSTKIVPQILAPELNRPQDDHRERIRYTFDQLERLSAEQGPKYVYAHIVSPHDPYVFGAEGEAVEPPAADAADPAKQQAYANQARFISRRTLQMLRAILANSATQPVILLQADHGPSLNSTAGRVGILNAYLFPGAKQAIDPGITPVNSFRVLFNSVFGTSFTRLPDVSYFSVYSAPYDFTVIPPSCPT